MTCQERDIRALIVSFYTFNGDFWGQVGFSGLIFYFIRFLENRIYKNSFGDYWARNSESVA